MQLVGYLESGRWRQTATMRGAGRSLVPVPRERRERQRKTGGAWSLLRTRLWNFPESRQTTGNLYSQDQGGVRDLPLSRCFKNKSPKCVSWSTAWNREMAGKAGTCASNTSPRPRKREPSTVVGLPNAGLSLPSTRAQSAFQARSSKAPVSDCCDWRIRTRAGTRLPT